MAGPIIKFSPNDLRNETSIWLQNYRKNKATKHGEDGIIGKIFEVIGTENKVLCDVGAANGKLDSNSYHLLANKSWRGVLFEPTKLRFRLLKELYADDDDAVTLCTYVGLHKSTRLDTHLDNLGSIPQNFDFLSIDIDGCDFHIWQDVQRYRPRLVCIEFNPRIPLDVYFMQAKDLTVNHGSSLLAIYTEAQKMGYELVATTKTNAFFVEHHNYAKFNIPDNTPTAMHFLEGKETKILMAYDGHLFLAGNTHHPWKNYEITEENIQVLPPDEQLWKPDGRLAFAKLDKRKSNRWLPFKLFQS
ncbi:MULTISPECIES: FkbM family methyltransferase [unclassified Pseudovibrio]|uniref:FkbM family methyltransferase n=1 Tax=unclassified Pseudovibrio TaxID=2627060 RepID=UPI0007AEAEC5|nr:MULTISPECIES: FkbM family methyltransferase [unclassified Pseudovibrio]KZK93146.1 hypothetical protein PsW74_05301 [Pseudovibrio sp. W74]KZL07037.1 hypothetical protein PsAD14_04504 [Pseudovibrio sp. Ad14]